jgi:hypothetical protein
MAQITEDRLATSDYVATGDRAERERAAERTERNETAGGELLSANSTQDLRGEWDRVQGEFVDDPRSAVKKADELVANAMQRLTDSFKDQRSNLEQQWDRGEDVSCPFGEPA